FSSHDKAAALMPYLMGGYPDLDASRAVGEACADAGADLLELGVPFSDPLADGPTIHAAATAALGAGATLDGVLGVCETLAARGRAATDLPVAVGFGISSGDQARRVAEIADGVIVGSRVVRAAGEGGAEAVRGVVAELAAALGSARG